MKTRDFAATLRSVIGRVAPPAALLGACTNVPPGIENDPGFVPATCVGAARKVLGGLSPEPQVDYLELRDIGSSVTVAESSGERCSGASDPLACEAELATLAPPKGFFDGSCFGEVCTPKYLVATRGSDVLIVGDAGELRAFLGAIDTPSEAMLMAGTKAIAIACDRGGGKPSGNGFDVQGFRAVGCDGRDRFIYHVATDGTITLLSQVEEEGANPNCSVGRRPAGLLSGAPRPLSASHLVSYWSEAARLEAAAVLAFRALATELQAHGAPARLVRAARRAAADEVRHARATAALARRHGAGDIAKPQVIAQPSRNLESVILENVTEGCVRETYGALAGLWQAEHAADLTTARMMRVIAADEVRHAALSWQVAAWALPKLSRAGRARVRDALHGAVADLWSELQRNPAASLVNEAGLPCASDAGRLHEELRRVQWSLAWA